MLKLTEQDFVNEFGHKPLSLQVLRIYNGIDPFDETEMQPYTGKPTLEQYRQAWIAQAASADGFRCVYREPNGQIRCKSCGMTKEDREAGGKLIDLYSCQHPQQTDQSCTIRPSQPTDGTKTLACSACPHRQSVRPPTKRLTVGMACLNDAMRVRWTIGTMMDMHRDILDDIEFLIADNGSDAENLDSLKHLERINPGRVRLIHCEQRGTFPPKAMLFDHAAGEVVLVIDSHVRVRGSGLKTLIDFFEAHKAFSGLVTGELYGDDGNVFANCMKPSWGNSFGTWDRKEFEAGYDTVSIPMCAGAFFAVRRSDWPKQSIPSGLRGYGGDEWLGQLFHHLGRPVVAIRGVEWWHDFWGSGKEKQVTDQQREDQFRNDMLWAKACGKLTECDRSIECHMPSLESIKRVAEELNVIDIEGSIWLGA